MGGRDGVGGLAAVVAAGDVGGAVAEVGLTRALLFRVGLDVGVLLGEDDAEDDADAAADCDDGENCAACAMRAGSIVGRSSSGCSDGSSCVEGGGGSHTIPNLATSASKSADRRLPKSAFFTNLRSDWLDGCCSAALLVVLLREDRSEEEGTASDDGLGRGCCCCC